MKSFGFIYLRSPLQSLELTFKEVNFKNNSLFSSAVNLAAPELSQELSKIDFFDKKEHNKINSAIQKYWIRSCTRCTPFGYFAGGTVIELNDDFTDILRNSNEQHIVRARLDMGFLHDIKQQIENDPLINNQLKFTVNDSLYNTPMGYRYAEFSINGDLRSYKLSSVEHSEYLEFLTDTANFPATTDELCRAFMQKYQAFSYEEAKNFVLDLINAQILVSSLELHLTGKDPLIGLIEELSGIAEAKNTLENLKIVSRLLKDSNKVNIKDLKEQIKSRFKHLRIPKNLLQVDLSLSLSKGNVNQVQIDVILNQLVDLFSLSRASFNPDMDSFKARFIERYDGAEIPLNIALDNDLGIGYGSNSNAKGGADVWIDNLNVGVGVSRKVSFQDYITDYTFAKYQNFIKQKSKEINLEEEELKNMKKISQNHQFPSSLYAMGSLLAMDDSFIFDLSSLVGPSAANILGRFTLDDTKLSSLTKASLLDEEAQNSDSIFAEVVHNPQARLGNILLRANLRNFEVTYLGKSGLDKNNQLKVQDINVSVVEGEVILRSVKHNKRIIPRMSNAHNFRNNGSLPIYRFLCDLQSQDLAVPNVWDWGVLESLDYLPRVSYKNLIIKKARWILTEAELLAFTSNSNKIVSLLKQRRVPNYFTIVQGDNRLLINRKNQKSLDLMVSILKKYKSVLLEEFLFNSKNCIVRDLEGKPYTNEIIIPIHHETHAKSTKEIEILSSPSLDRKFAPNSEWLYFKIYGGEKTLDKILMTDIFHFVKEEIAKSGFKKFFFVRYNDKLGSNLRLRFLNDDTIKQSALQSAFIKMIEPYLKKEMINNLTLDTYVREIERYSGDLMEESESIFFSDSLAVLELNKILSEVEDAKKYRLLLAMRGIDIFMSDFDLNTQEKHIIMKLTSENFFQEFGGSPFLKSSLNDKYRALQSEIFSHMDSLKDEDNGFTDAIEIFNNRSLHNQKSIEVISSRFEGMILQGKLSRLLSSYIHMFMNRLFISNQRKYELLVYSSLERYYNSQLAIKRKRKM